MKKICTLIIYVFTAVLAATDLGAQCSSLQLTANRTKGCVPDILSFSVTGAPSGSTYLWTVGSDTKSGKDQLNYTFLNKGVYTVSVKVTFPDNTSCNLSKSNLVTIGETPQNLDFSISKTRLCQPDTITLTGPPGMMKYDWLVEGKNNLNSSRIFKYIFTSPGQKTITLRVTDSTGCVALKTKENIVFVSDPPVYSFQAATVRGCIPFSVAFLANIKEGGSKIVSYKWDFPGGNPSSSTQLKPPPVVYSSVGDFDVTLTLKTQDGCEYITKYPNYVETGTPVTLSFNTDKIKGMKEETFTLTNTTAGNLKGNFWWGLSGGVAKTGSTLEKQLVKFNAKGLYDITLFYDNNGCVTELKKTAYIEVIDTAKPKPPSICDSVVAAFNISKQGFCTGDTIALVNSNKSSNYKYKWSANKAGVTFIPSDTDMEPKFIISTPDTFEIKLTVTGVDTCKSEEIKKVWTYQPDASFTTNDTLNSCAPAYVSFNFTGVSADTFFWDFGDGEKLVTTTGNVAHVYKTNTGEDLTKGFTVKLKTKTNAGCIGIFERQNYIKVTGPTPAFKSSSNYIGTEPFYVQFKNTSTKPFLYIFDYGDNSKSDTNIIRTHAYIVQDPNQPYQIYMPKMLVKDQNGCSAIGEAEDSIVVYKKPLPAFTATPKHTCENIAVQFIDSSRYAVKWEWDFEDDGKIDDTTQNPLHHFTHGNFRTKLTVYNAIGYDSSIYFHDTIVAIKKPDASFTASKQVGCLEDTISFTASKLSPDVTKTKWIIQDGNDSVIYTNTATVTYKFKYAGKHKVILMAENDAGCRDTFIANDCVEIMDTILAEVPRIRFVTFLDDTKVQISWKKSTAANNYYLYKKNGSIDELLYVAKNITDTVFIDNTIGSKRDIAPAYNLRIGNICGNTSEKSKEHIAIILNTTSDSGRGSNTLKWSSYFGWNSVNEYQVYRAAGNDSFSLLATVPGTQTEYSDTELCNQDYNYYIKAKSPSGIYFSMSNTSGAKPSSSGQAENLQLNYVTVGDNNAIVVEWEKSNFYKTKKYIIDKYSSKTGWKENYASTTATIWKDNKVDVQNDSYRYRIRVEDECGNLSVHSNIGKSILLHSKVKGDKIYLNWNTYGKWDKGAKNQIVQLKLGDSPFRTLPPLSGKDSALTDYMDYNDPNGSYCYRVIAVENDNNPDSSHSNISCILLPAKLQVPTAFTPNGDGLNDEFKISAHAIHNLTGSSNLDFQLHIYDRNGQRVFETLDVTEGWNGKIGELDAPEGNYTFMIYAIGQDKQRFYVEGTLTLLRALR